MLMCNLIEYSENHSQTSGNRERYCKDELHDSIIRDSKSLKYKVRITGKPLMVVTQKMLKQLCDLST